MTKAKPFRDVGDGCVGCGGCAGDLQEQLMLLRLQSCIHRGLLAEVEKLPQVIAEIGEGLELIRVSVHRYIYRNTM
jgi:hypothetical protein